MHTKASSVLTLVFDKSKTLILLVKRRDVPMWVLPGGGVEEEETPEFAAEREVLEESGLKVHSLKLLAQYATVNSLARNTNLYSAIAGDGLIEQTDESCDVAFFRLEEFPVNTFHIHRNWIEESLRATHVIQRPLNEISYFNVFKYFIKNPLTFLRYFMSWLGLPINK